MMAFPCEGTESLTSPLENDISASVFAINAGGTYASPDSRASGRGSSLRPRPVSPGSVRPKRHHRPREGFERRRPAGRRRGGDEPETVTDSSTAPTRSSALTVAVKFDGSSMPSCTIVLNPGIVNVTLYSPG